MNSTIRRGGRARKSRLTAAVAALALLPISAGALASASAAAPDDGLVAEYLFTQSSGTTVENTATGADAVGDATVVNGTDMLWTGDSLVFTGGAKNSTGNWVELPDGVLAGEESATITTEVKIDASMKSTYNFLWNIGNESNQTYYFVTVRDAPRTAITTASGGGEVNARSPISLDADRWYSLSSVIDGDAGTITFYIDGVEVASAPTSSRPRTSPTSRSARSAGRRGRTHSSRARSRPSGCTTGP